MLDSRYTPILEYGSIVADCGSSGLHRDVVSDCYIFLGYDVTSMGNRLPTFRRTVVPLIFNVFGGPGTDYRRHGVVSEKIPILKCSRRLFR